MGNILMGNVLDEILEDILDYDEMAAILHGQLSDILNDDETEGHTQ
jgi:ethanolamine utilization protein EutQ (cupin superfamily)